MKSAVKAIILKDIQEIRQSPSTFAPMILVPAILCIVLPLVLILAVKLGAGNQINGMEQMMALLAFYDVPANLTAIDDKLLYVFLNYTFMSMFLIVPVMVTAIIATNAIVGEKERKTLETLLYAPIGTGDLLRAKAMAAMIPGLFSAWLSWILYFLAANLASFAFGGPMLVRSPIWLVSLILVVPALTFLELSVTLLVCTKAKTFMDAQQLSSLVVLPLVGLMYSQIAGLVILSPLLLAILSLVLAFIAWILLRLAGNLYTREGIIARL